MISNFDIQKMLRDRKIICDCAMSLNDDREKILVEEKENPSEAKAIKVSCPLKYPQEC